MTCFLGGRSYAQWDDDFGEEEEFGEPEVTVNGHLKLQTGVFVPLISDGFKPLENIAYEPTATEAGRARCDPVKVPTNQCVPESHGKDAGSFSMGRATLQLEGDWNPHPDVTLHAIVRGVRSMKLEADEWGQMPVLELDPDKRREASLDWVHENYHTEFEFRELYLDTYPGDWISFRFGRQQIAWGELGQYRLLDVINPSDNTWHWGPTESFEDTRIPLWMAKGLIDIPSIEHSIELVWAPLFFDDPEDTVSVPLTFVGTWGLPYSNTPGGLVRNKVFNYPGGKPEDMRGGVRWKGASGAFTYTLVYYYTHQLSPPIPTYYLRAEDRPVEIEKFNLEFPRQHIAGLSFDYAFESPIGMVAKVESAVELPRTFPMVTNYMGDVDGLRNNFKPGEKVAVSYAVQLYRPTMLRFLNPTQNFIMVLQFMHSMIPGLTEEDKEQLVDIPGFNKMFVKEHYFTFIFATRTTYMNGLLTPGLVFAFIPPDNGFYTLKFNFRFNENWQMAIAATDFFGGDPYKSVGLFEDRDEVNLSLLCQF